MPKHHIFITKKWVNKPQISNNDFWEVCSRGFNSLLIESILLRTTGNLIPDNEIRTHKSTTRHTPEVISRTLYTCHHTASSPFGIEQFGWQLLKLNKIPVSSKIYKPEMRYTLGRYATNPECVCDPDVTAKLWNEDKK